MIEVTGLTKTFGGITALRNVSFTVEKGQIVGFLGANGAGKTTTLDIICGCSGADSGTAKVAGFDITENPLEAKRRLGYLPDVPPLHVEMQVEDYVSYSAKLHGIPRSDIPKRVEEVLDTLSLTEVRHRVIGNLSKGYRHRVAFAQAIVHDPEVLVLDEPTEGLDPNQIIQIRELIKSLGGQHTIILSSHILSEVQNTCDHIVIINEGQIVQSGKYEDLMAQAEAGQVYRLRVRKNASALVTKLRSLGDVTSAQAANGGDTEVEFAVGRSDNSVLDDVARQVIDGGHGLCELSLKTKSLEEIFLKLTH